MSYEETAQASYGDAREERDRDSLNRAAKGEPPIERELDRADKAARLLDDALTRLNGRLTPVLGPERPEPALGEVRQSDDASQLTNRLAELADRLEHLGALADRTYRRIEL